MNTEFPPTSMPLDPILIPDNPAGSPTPAVTKRELSPVAGIDKSTPKPAAPAKPRRRPRKPEKFTLEEAYMYFQGVGGPSARSRDLEKGIRAASYILDWAADGGGESVDGYLAAGIAKQLDTCADRVRRDREFIEAAREKP